MSSFLIIVTTKKNNIVVNTNEHWGDTLALCFCAEISTINFVFYLGASPLVTLKIEESSRK